MEMIGGGSVTVEIDLHLIATHGVTDQSKISAVDVHLTTLDPAIGHCHSLRRNIRKSFSSVLRVRSGKIRDTRNSNLACL